MVGVAGRSKACKTCKQRRKGCDYRRPRCLRCIQGGFECGGYDDTTHFVVYQASKSDRALHFAHARPAATSFTPLPPSLRNSALRDAYFNAAWRSLHPANGDPFSHAWLPSLLSVHNSESPLHLAFTAVSLARVGQHDQNRVLVQNSHAAYQRAVVGIQRRLFSQSKSLDEEIIACVLMLAVYETIHGSSKVRMASMLAHVNGAREMMRIHGPFTMSPTGQSILKDQRENAFLEALGSRKPSFFAQKTWTEFLPARSPKARLLNVAAAIPAVMRKFDRLKTLPSTSVTASDVESIRLEYMLLVSRLTEWREDQLPCSTFQRQPSKLLSNPLLRHLGSLCPRRRSYSTLAFAELEVIYATVQLMVHLEMLDLANSFQSARTQQTQDQRRHEITAQGKHESAALIDSAHVLQEAMEYVGIILESLEYFLEEETGVLAASATALPVMVVVAFLQRLDDPRVDFVLALIDEYQGRTSVRLADLITEGLNMGVRDEGQAVRWKDITGGPVNGV